MARKVIFDLHLLLSGGFGVAHFAAMPDEMPSDFKVFVNLGAMGFADVDTLKPAQSFTMEQEVSPSSSCLQIEPRPVQDVAAGKLQETQFVRFQNVSNISVRSLVLHEVPRGSISTLRSLQVFVDRNFGDADTTVIETSCNLVACDQ